MVIMDLIHQDEQDYFHMVTCGVVVGYGEGKQKLTCKVRLPYFEDGEDILENVRVVSSYAGKQHYQMIMPEIGDQVVLLMLSQNYEEAIIIGSLFDENSDVHTIVHKDHDIKAFHLPQGSEMQFKDKKSENIILLKCGELLISMDEKNDEVIIGGNNQKNICKVNQKDGFIQIEAKKAMSIKCGKSSITLDEQGTCSIKAEKLTLQSEQVVIKGRQKVAIEGQVVQISSNVNTKIESSGQTKVSASGVMEVSGGLVKLG